MGLILIPSEVMICAEELRDFLAQNADSYNGTMQKVQSFSWNTELKTVTYDTLKEKLPMVHGIIVQTMMMAQESVNSDLSMLESSVGNEDLFEDDLVLQIERLNAECRNYENTISNLQELCRNPFIEMLGFVSSYLSELIESNHALLEHTRAEILRLEEKLDFLYEVSNSTRGLFQAGIDLFGMADNAIHDSVVAITGVGEYTKGELDWKILLPESINEKNKEIEVETKQAIIDTLLEELGIEIEVLEEMYEEEILEQLKEYVRESEIDLTVSADKQDFVVKVMSEYSEYEISVLNGKYYYVDLDGKKKELTNRKALIMLENKAEYEHYLEVIDEVGEWYVNNVTTYCKMTKQEVDEQGESTARGRGYYQCTMDGNLSGLKVGDDCSSYVWACLVQLGYFKEDTEVFTSIGYLPSKADLEKVATDEMEAAGFVWYSMEEIGSEGLEKGDLLVKNGHVEFFESFNDKGIEVAWTWGSVYMEEPTRKKHDRNAVENEYAGVWRLEGKRLDE